MLKHKKNIAILRFRRVAAMVLMILALLSVFAGCRNGASTAETSPETETSAEIPEKETATAEDSGKEETEADVSDSVAIGPLRLGMSRDEVRDILGEPDSVLDPGETEVGDGIWLVTWSYAGDDSAKLDLAFVDMGKGWFLNHAYQYGDWKWETAGIRFGSSGEDVMALYPDAETGEYSVAQKDGNTQWRYYAVTCGGIPIRFDETGGGVCYIDIGPLVEETWDDYMTEE